MNQTWQALAREAGLAAEQLAIGITALGRANYAHHAYYGQAFFALSIGLERGSKLAIVVDHALENNGAFPSHRALRGYGHNLKQLLKAVDGISQRRNPSGVTERLPSTAIHDGIIGVLSDFASNITRYYNLDLVTGDPQAAKQDDPIQAWFERVIIPVLAAHQRPRQRVRIQQNAQLIAELLGPHILVRHHAETGDPLDTAYDASRQTGMTDFAKPYVRMYVMQIARFLARLLSRLGTDAQRSQLDTVPYLWDFFVIFDQSDEYFRSRKTWSIYRR